MRAVPPPADCVHAGAGQPEVPPEGGPCPVSGGDGRLMQGNNAMPQQGGAMVLPAQPVHETMFKEARNRSAV